MKALIINSILDAGGSTTATMLDYKTIINERTINSLDEKLLYPEGVLQKLLNDYKAQSKAYWNEQPTPTIPPTTQGVEKFSQTNIDKSINYTINTGGKSWNFNKYSINIREARIIATALKNKKINKFNKLTFTLTFSNITNDGLLLIVQALTDNNIALKELMINGKNILLDTTLDQLINSLKLPPTQNAEVTRVLDLINQNSDGKWFLEKQSITSIGAQVIATTIIENNKDGPRDTATNINVSLLNLNNNKIGDEGAKIIATALIQNKTLTNLNLYNNNIGDEGAKAIANALKQNTILTGLNLSGNMIGDVGAIAIVDALKINNKLTKLDLSNNNIGDELVKEIANALKKNALVEKFSEHNKNNKKNNKNNNNIIIVSIILLLVIITILTIILLK